MKIVIVVFLMVSTTSSNAFRCYECNSNENEDDTKPCIDQGTECPEGTRGCSMIMYISDNDQEIHLRKFCTSAGTPIAHYLDMFSSSGLCQSILTENGKIRFVNAFDRRKRDAHPPSPPQEYGKNMLCACNMPLCNGGDHKSVIERIVLSPLSLTEESIPFSLQEVEY